MYSLSKRFLSNNFNEKIKHFDVESIKAHTYRALRRLTQNEPRMTYQ